MKNHSQIILTLILAAAFSLSFLPTQSEAQGFNFYGQNPFSFMGFGKADRKDELGKNVYSMDSIADQMAWRFGWETRYRRGCNDSIALLKLMKSHTGLTNDLIKAYKGDNANQFIKAAAMVRDNLNQIQSLRKRVEMSDTVAGLITKSTPLAAYVHRNAHLFRPVPTVKSQPSLHGAPPVAQPHGGNGHGHNHDPNQNKGFSETGNRTNAYSG